MSKLVEEVAIILKDVPDSPLKMALLRLAERVDKVDDKANELDERTVGSIQYSGFKNR